MTTYAPIRYLLLTEQWRDGQNRWTFPVFGADGKHPSDEVKAAVLERAKRVADESPGRNFVILEKLSDKRTGAYSEVERMEPTRPDGRYLDALPEPEEPESQDVEIENKVLQDLAKNAEAGRVAAGKP